MSRLSIVQRSVLVIDDQREIGEAIAVVAHALGMSCTVLTSALQLEEELDPTLAAVVVAQEVLHHLDRQVTREVEHRVVEEKGDELFH